MDTGYDDFLTDEMIDQCEQVRSIAKKSWLSSASVSLAHLDTVKARVYNVGLVDPRDLKATNLTSKKKGPELTAEPQLSSLLERNSTAWGSNNSIPDLVHQQGNTFPTPARPASAKTSGKWTRPPSGKKNRPQSAKEPIQVPYSHSEGEVEPKQGFGVKGAKYDPNGRPPKGFSYTSSVGWVGPPAGLKYPDKPSNGDSWTIDFPMDGEEKAERPVDDVEAVPEVPRPPHTTPVPPTPQPEEKKKRIFELYIGDPYMEDDNFIQSDSEEEEFGPSCTTSNITSHTSSQISPMRLDDSQKGSLRLDLPITDEDFDEIDEVDTERLLAEAEAVTQNLDLKGIISANKHIPHSDTSQVTTQNDEKQTATYSQTELSTTSKAKARNLVSQIIDENGLEFKKPDADRSKNKTEVRPPSSVKFSEDVRTVSITPRNIGRRVEEMHYGKKRNMHHHADSGFVDLIEMKNRIEPVLSTSKAELSAPSGRIPHSPNDSHTLSKSKQNSGSRPPSGIAKPSSSSVKVQTRVNNKAHVSTSSCPTDVALNLNRPKSAPLNRAPKPITTVTVDYGEIDKKEGAKEKPKRKKGTDDIETVMGAINRKLKDEHDLDHHLNNIKTKECDEDLNTNTDNVLSTMVKSEPIKNYYEISRHSSLSNYSVLEDTASPLNANKLLNNTSVSVPVIKTTKTLEFDEIKPKEVTIKSLLDQQTLSTKDKEHFVSSMQLKDESRPRSRIRPSSAKPPISKQPMDDERPGSRRSFVPVTQTKPERIEHKTKKLTRPSSAPVQKMKRASKGEMEDKSDKENIGVDKTKPLSKQEKDERDKVIDNLLERTKTLLEGSDKKLESDKSELTINKSVRPSSAQVGLVARKNDQRRVKSATTKSPVVSTTTTKHKHYASYSQGVSSVKSRKAAGKTKTKVVLTEPCIITTNTQYYEEETEEDLACKDLEKTLADKGVNIAADTLQRALYPPSGKSKHYQITADLPRRPSVSLLSHPKVWLPQEYKKLQQAEKILSRANEIMFLQKRAEVRRAKLEALGPEERKKLKKKGKKGGKKLRKSQTVG